MKWIAVAMAAVMGLTGCGSGSKTSEAGKTDVKASKEETKDGTDSANGGTINFFSNVPDRTAGLGLLEETNLNIFKEANPGLNIETEQLQDEPYKVKLQTYMQSGNMPDVWMQWGSAAMMNPIVAGGYAEPLNPDDYKDFNFVPGALDSFTVDGVLYGLPKNADFWVLYYNQKILEDNGIKVPETTDDLIAAADILNAKGIVPVSLTGKDQWPTAETFHNLVIRCMDDPAAFSKAVKEGKTADNKEFQAGADELMRLIDAKVFQPSFNADDYGTAKNMFIQGNAAMYLMGSWEMGMASDESIDPEIRDNIRAAKFPTVNGYNGDVDNLVMWYGGGYSISANSENKEAAKELLYNLLKPENYVKNAWQNQIVIPPMNYEEYMTGDENDLQKDLTEIMSSAKFTTGDGFQDLLTPSFKTDSQNLLVELTSEMITPEDFFQRLDELAKDNME